MIHGFPKVRECPVSYIAERSIRLVQLFFEAGHASSALGASLYGPDLSQWPAEAAQAMIQCEDERLRIERAQQERDALQAR